MATIKQVIAKVDMTSVSRGNVTKYYVSNTYRLEIEGYAVDEIEVNQYVATCCYRGECVAIRNIEQDVSVRVFVQSPVAL